MPYTANNIDLYLSKLKGDRHDALDALRTTIRSIAPKATECMRYGIPAFQLDGKLIAGFAATAQGCTYYPFSASTLRALAYDLVDYEKSRSLLHFDPAQPLPPKLVRLLIETRIAERPLIFRAAR